MIIGESNVKSKGRRCPTGERISPGCREEVRTMVDLIVLGLWSLFCIPKAALEAAYFQDRKSAKRTLSRWAIGAGCFVVAFATALFVDYFG